MGPEHYIGFYGCSDVLVRVAWMGPTVERRREGTGALSTTTKRPATSWRVKCPVCKHEHNVNVTWRQFGARESDQWIQPDIRLPREGLNK